MSDLQSFGFVIKNNEGKRVGFVIDKEDIIDARMESVVDTVPLRTSSVPHAVYVNGEPTIEITIKYRLRPGQEKNLP